MEPQKEIQQLTKELEHAGFLYYVKDAPDLQMLALLFRYFC